MVQSRKDFAQMPKILLGVSKYHTCALVCACSQVKVIGCWDGAGFALLCVSVNYSV